MRRSTDEEHEDVMIMTLTYNKITVVTKAACMIKREGSTYEAENP